MSVTITVYENGRTESEHIYPGKNIQIVLELLREKGVDYSADIESEEAKEKSKKEKLKLICLDDTNILNVEGSANFISEYTFEYEENLIKELHAKLTL
ncbi:hypothetical protein JMA_22290 [Jeotgalibacillus malaysiensis]|uniref:Uncharacterized protein n=1 Tax=Jeotgalibacillus malaysiensis TaxID=1508404 RepID=A0A0B5AN25_9BACL|nr:hypothetical protein [Jeotgalibacillus malaysiensis]AJD91546.1 hypothetical protein JMA_22290 [Jeotgalibacillus malaysiensis]